MRKFRSLVGKPSQMECPSPTNAEESIDSLREQIQNQDKRQRKVLKKLDASAVRVQKEMKKGNDKKAMKAMERGNKYGSKLDNLQKLQIQSQAQLMQMETELHQDIQDSVAASTPLQTEPMNENQDEQLLKELRQLMANGKKEKTPNQKPRRSKQGDGASASLGKKQEKVPKKQQGSKPLQDDHHPRTVESRPTKQLPAEDASGAKKRNKIHANNKHPSVKSAHNVSPKGPNKQSGVKSSSSKNDSVAEASGAEKRQSTSTRKQSENNHPRTVESAPRKQLPAEDASGAKKRNKIHANNKDPSVKSNTAHNVNPKGPNKQTGVKSLSPNNDSVAEASGAKKRQSTSTRKQSENHRPRTLVSAPRKQPAAEYASGAKKRDKVHSNNKRAPVQSTAASKVNPEGANKQSGVKSLPPNNDLVAEEGSAKKKHLAKSASTTRKQRQSRKPDPPTGDSPANQTAVVKKP